MDTMEDSGFDSDQKLSACSSADTPIKLSKSGSAVYQSLRTTSDLQKKIENQREKNRKPPSGDSSKARSLLHRARLVVPHRNEQLISSPDQQPLVMIETDDSDDEFCASALSSSAHRAITEQLIKDGYNLDLEPDDEDLDLIPPRPLKERYCCHAISASCTIQ